MIQSKTNQYLDKIRKEQEQKQKQKQKDSEEELISKIDLIIICTVILINLIIIISAKGNAHLFDCILALFIATFISICILRLLRIYNGSDTSISYTYPRLIVNSIKRKYEKINFNNINKLSSDSIKFYENLRMASLDISFIKSLADKALELHKNNIPYYFPIDGKFYHDFVEEKDIEITKWYISIELKRKLTPEEDILIHLTKGDFSSKYIPENQKLHLVNALRFIYKKQYTLDEFFNKVYLTNYSDELSYLPKDAIVYSLEQRFERYHMSFSGQSWQLLSGNLRNYITLNSN